MAAERSPAREPLGRESGIHLKPFRKTATKGSEGAWLVENDTLGPDWYLVRISGAGWFKLDGQRSKDNGWWSLDDRLHEVIEELVPGGNHYASVPDMGFRYITKTAIDELVHSLGPDAKRIELRALPTETDIKLSKKQRAYALKMREARTRSSS